LFFPPTRPPTRPLAHPHPATRVCNPRDATFPRRNRCFNQYAERRFAHDIPRTVRDLKPYTTPPTWSHHPDVGSIKTRTSSYEHILYDDIESSSGANKPLFFVRNFITYAAGRREPIDLQFPSCRVLLF